MMKFLGPSFVLAGAALLAGCAGDGEQPEQQSASGFTEAPQTLTTKTTALPIQSDFNDLRSAVDAERDIAFVASASGTQVSALRLATRQHLWQLTLDGGVDQIFFDTEGRRLYISTATSLTVLDSMSGALLRSVEIQSPIVAITYLPARGDYARSHLVIGQRISANEWQLSALEPNLLEVMASITLPAIDDDAKLQITAGAGLIWTMNYQGQRLYTIRPYLLRGDSIYPIDDHQVVDSLRDTGLMISPDGEWLITGGNNLLSTALDSEAQEFVEGLSRGFDGFSPTVTGGGVFTGPGFELMVRDDLVPNTVTAEREVSYFNRFSVRQVLSTVSGIYALGYHDALGQAVQWVTSNTVDLPSAENLYGLSAGQTFIPFDGLEGHQQGDLYFSAVFAAGNGLATVQPVCFEPCTYANALQVPLLGEAQQAYIDIHQLTDGPIAGVIVTASGDVQMGEAEWSLNIPSACPGGAQITGDINSDDLLGIGYQDVPCETVISNDPEINSIRICAPDPTIHDANQFNGDIDNGNIDLHACADEERAYSVIGTYCAENAVDCEMNLTLAGLSCDAALILFEGSYSSELSGLPSIHFGGLGESALIGRTVEHDILEVEDLNLYIYGEIGEEARKEGVGQTANLLTGTISVNAEYTSEVAGAVDEPNVLLGTVELLPSFPDELTSVPSKTTCF